MAQAKSEMIQEPFQAMQGDPRRFTSLRDDPRPFKSAMRRTCLGPDASREEERGRPFEMIEGQLRGLAATAGSFEEAGLNQIGLMDIFEGALVFLDRRRQGFHPDRSSSKLVDDGQKNLTIHLIKPRRIDTQPRERVLGYSLGNSSLRLDLGIVAHPFDKPEGRVTQTRSEEHTSELQSRLHLVCRL